MRTRSLRHILLVASLMSAVLCRHAAAQAEAARSTLRIVPSQTAATPAPLAVPAEVPGPQFESPANIDQPPSPPATFEVRQAAAEAMPPEPIEQPQISQPESIQRSEIRGPVTRATPTVRPQQTAAQYPVQQTGYAAPVPATPLIHASAPGRAPSMVNVYSSSNAQATLSKMPRPAPVQPRATGQATRQRGKPFQGMQSEPAISPYLNMYRTDANANSLPNYFAYVRPQLEQQEASRQQAAEIQKLRGQLQNISSAGAAAPTSASMTAHAHYMDTGQFYRNYRR